MRESKVEDHLKREAKRLGGSTRKVQWIGRAHAPDELVLLPGRHFFAEMKRDDNTKPFPATVREERQHAEHKRMRAAGIVVYVLDSIEKVDAALKEATKSHGNPLAWFGDGE